ADQEQHPRLVTRHVTRPTPVCPAETPHSSTFTGRQLRNPGTTMITRAVEAGLPAGWVTGDEVYGSDPDLRAQLETLGLGYVLGIGCNRRVTIHAARGGVRTRADQIAAGLGEHCWTRYSAGAGAKGPRFYDWAFIALHPDDGPGHRWLLIRRHPEHGELAYYRCHAPRP